MEISKALLNNFLTNPIGSEEGRSIYRVGQSLYNITVFNKKAEKLLNTTIETKYTNAKRYARYVKDISKINQAITMLLNEGKRNSYKRILVKLRKNFIRYPFYRPMLSVFRKQEQSYRRLIVEINVDTERAIAFHRILSDKSFSPTDSNLNDDFIKCLQVVKPKIANLMGLNNALIKIYFDVIRRDTNTDIKYRHRRLKDISKLIKKKPNKKI